MRALRKIAAAAALLAALSGCAWYGYGYHHGYSGCCHYHAWHGWH